MSKHTAVLATLFIAAALTASYLGYRYAIVAGLLTDVSTERDKLTKVIQDLTGELTEVDQARLIEQSHYTQTLSNKEQQIETKDVKIAELTALLAVAEKNAMTYRSRYMSEKKVASNAQVSLSRALEEEKRTLEAKNKEKLANQLSELEGEYSAQAEKAESEKRVDELMTDFASLQVDLDVINTCDKAYLERYGEAKSMLSHMRTYIQKSSLSQDYYYFVISNDALLARKTREICIEN
ncbi:hypothetical protein [Vibrio sp. TBV020]|uniref:hypothetical protein n=1 Tax=Vibrio sp. TBV020 TaxID=3137398 RepID=UPI0038CDB6CC